MKPLLSLIFSALMLAGCARGYDEAAKPGAQAALDQALNDCKARLAANEIQTWTDMALCSLAAEHAYYAAIKLQRMDTFQLYAVNYQRLAAARDAHAISDRQARARANRIRNLFYAECNCGPAQFGPVPRATDYIEPPSLVPPPPR